MAEKTIPSDDSIIKKVTSIYQSAEKIVEKTKSKVKLEDAIVQVLKQRKDIGDLHVFQNQIVKIARDTKLISHIVSVPITIAIGKLTKNEPQIWDRLREVSMMPKGNMVDVNRNPAFKYCHNFYTVAQLRSGNNKIENIKDEIRARLNFSTISSEDFKIIPKDWEQVLKRFCVLKFKKNDVNSAEENIFKEFQFVQKAVKEMRDEIQVAVFKNLCSEMLHFVEMQMENFDQDFDCKNSEYIELNMQYKKIQEWSGELDGDNKPNVKLQKFKSFIDDKNNLATLSKDHDSPLTRTVNSICKKLGQLFGFGDSLGRSAHSIFSVIKSGVETRSPIETQDKNQTLGH